MRVRVNYTLDVDVDQYCDATDQDLTKMEVRSEIQEQCITETIKRLEHAGVEVNLLGRNNVYDAAQKLTVAEHLVTAQ